MAEQIIIKNGLYFDGTGADGVLRHIAIQDGRVQCVSASPLDEAGASRVIDAQGRWVTPGFIEPHSHYDAEIIAAPELPESVRHGVTTVMTGICSISMVCAEAEDCSDLFTRVEAVPREVVLPLLHEKKSWSRPKEFREFFEQHPLGPNLAAFLGHSDLRAACMGLVRSVSKDKPTEAELQQMEADERGEFCEEMGVSQYDRETLIQQIMDSSGQMLFFTAGEKEVRTWLIPKGATAVDAAGNIHTDLAKGFVRAETMTCDDLFRLGSEREIKANNLMRKEHKDYVIQDGDILHILSTS